MAEDHITHLADKLRDLKNWFAVFADEYNLPEEARKKLHEKIDAIGKELGVAVGGHTA